MVDQDRQRRKIKAGRPVSCNIFRLFLTCKADQGMTSSVHPQILIRHTPWNPEARQRHQKQSHTLHQTQCSQASADHLYLWNNDTDILRRPRSDHSHPVEAERCILWSPPSKMPTMAHSTVAFITMSSRVTVNTVSAAGSATPLHLVSHSYWTFVKPIISFIINSSGKIPVQNISFTIYQKPDGFARANHCSRT